MSYVAYSNFLREVLPYCPGAPTSSVTDAIRNACIQFCEQSHWLQYTPTPQNAVAGIGAYSVYTPTDTRMTEIIEIWFSLFRLTPKSNDELTALYGTDWRTLTGSPVFYTHTDDATQVLLVPAPATATPTAIAMLVAICPTRDSLTVDSDIYERWLEVIADGALARILATPQVSFSNVVASEARARRFRAGVSRATIARNQGLVRTPTIMRPPRFF